MGKLTNIQLRQVAEFTANLGLVFFASAITPIFTAVDKVNPLLIISGLVLMMGCLIGSLIILKGVENES